MASLGDVLVGRYRLDALIGVGGFATVFRAHDLRLERDVALKVLLPNHAADPLVVARFDREARALAAFSHPNVVGIHDVEPADPSVGQEPFLVMDLCEGGSLAEQLAAAGGTGVAPDVLVPILVDVSAGLDALHDAGMVHRDVKPSNVLLSGGRALIADLGIVAVESGGLTASSEAIGTLAFLAPEQLAGASATPASDVHALGVVAYLGLTGRLPRPAGSVAELVAASRQDPPPVSMLAPGLGTFFDRPIASALSPEPVQRPTVGQLALRLERGLERWGESAAIARTSVAGGSVPPVAPPPDLPSAPSPDDPTVIAVPVPTTMTLPLSTTHPPATTSEATSDVGASGVGGRDLARRPQVVLGALLIGLAAIAVLAIVLSISDDRPGRASSATTPTASPTTSQPPSPATTTTAIPTADALYASAGEASLAMHEAIAAARGGKEGLKGREAKVLNGHLARLDRAIDTRDAAGARAAAADVAKTVRALVDAREVSGDAGARLLDAAERLAAAADKLPD